MDENPYVATTPVSTTTRRRLSWRRIGELAAISVTVAITSSLMGIVAGWLTVLAIAPREDNLASPPHFQVLFVTGCGLLMTLIVSQASAIGLTMIFGRHGYSIR